MKNTKIILITIIVLLLAPTILAHNYHEATQHDNYNYLDTNDGIIFIVADHSYFYEEEETNENRYPTYDYRHGYTYRTTTKYFEHKQDNNYYEDDCQYSYRQQKYQESPDYYYIYNENIRRYEQHECYNYPPKNKLFYVRCP